jgi:hypothetical protein
MNRLVLCGIEKHWVFDVTDGQLQTLVAVALSEKDHGWQSTRLLSLLEQQECGLLQQSQTDEIVDKLRAWLKDAARQAADARQRGLGQARNCLGKFGSKMSPDANPIQFAVTAIAKYVESYAQFSQKHRIVSACKVKSRTFGTPAQESAVYRLDAAVRSAHKTHPEWPVTCAGLVRLFPRRPQPTTCAAIHVHFEGHEQQAVVWPVE